MISHKYRTIFVHIPKTAGISIERNFVADAGLEWKDRAPLILGRNPDRARGPERISHLKAHEYVELGHIDQEAFSNYYKFSFVRNPWARIVSEYNYRKLWHEMTFKSFVMHNLPQADDYSNDYRHIIPQSDYLYDSNGKQLVDFVGRFENLQKDFTKVCSEINFPDSMLLHYNSSKPTKWTKRIKFFFKKSHSPKFKNFREYYDAETVEFVSNLYKKDIELFNYQFE